MKLPSLTIGRKLALMAGASAVLTIVLAFAAYQSMTLLYQGWQHFQTGPREKTNAVAEGRSHLGNAIQNFKNYVLRGKDYDQRFLKDIGQVEKSAAAYRTYGEIDQQENEALDSINKGIAAYRAAMAKAVEMKAAGKTIEEIDQSIEGADKALKKAFDELTIATREEADKMAEHITSLVTLGTQVIIAVAGISLVVGSVLAWTISIRITVPLRKAVDIAETVALGDLTKEIVVESNDETGKLIQALKAMNESLVRILGDVHNGSVIIASASQQIASGNADLSSRTEEQASSLEETASSMEELTSIVKQNTDNAHQANSLALSASEVAEKGGAVVAQVVETMGSINESAKRIVDIISVIDGIAFQTNILALNAAVEAARAGEQGRGFAVVASEVRNLAQRSAAAAKEIKGLITDSVERVDAGSRLVGQAGTTMDEVVNSVKRLTVIMAEITSSSEQQSVGIEETNKAITTMDQVAQQNTALVEEAASAAESLQNQADHLARAVSVFRFHRA